MIINALAKYYDCLVKQENSPLAPKGFSKVKISYIVKINSNGEICGILPNTYTVLERGKEKEMPKTLMFPERIEISAIRSNIIEHRPNYLFGFEANGDAFEISDKSKKSFENAKICNMDFLDGLNSPLANAMYNFYSNWRPENELQNAHLLSILKSFNGSYYTFCLEDDINSLINDNEEILKKINIMQESASNEVKVMAQCSVCGDVLPIARTHDKLKKINGGLSSGTNLVCCNNESESSYNLEQGFVGGISEKVMKKYTAAFNCLTDSETNKSMIGDMSVLFWAETEEKPVEYANIIGGLCGLTRDDVISQVSIELQNCIRELQKGKVVDYAALGMYSDVNFYILGIVPNGARLAIKLFTKNTFGEVVNKVEEFVDDIIVQEGQQTPSVYAILHELVSPKSDAKIPNSSLSSALMESILTGKMFPQKLLTSVLLRIKTDQDEDKNNYIKINNIRVGIIKAYLNRKQRINNKLENNNRNKDCNCRESCSLNYASELAEVKKGECYTMAINENSIEKSYLCGRLFAVLEKLQSDANPGLNATIKSRYFGSACTTPSMVFPRLIKLAQTHIDKLDNSVYLERKMSEILDKMDDSFPKMLSIEEQGKFVIGYYQQNRDLYTKKTTQE